MAFLSCALARPLSCWPPLALEAKLGHLSIRLALSEVLSEEVSAFSLVAIFRDLGSTDGACLK